MKPRPELCPTCSPEHRNGGACTAFGAMTCTARRALYDAGYAAAVERMKARCVEGHAKNASLSENDGYGAAGALLGHGLAYQMGMHIYESLGDELEEWRP